MKNVSEGKSSVFRFISKTFKSLASISVIALFVIGLAFFVKKATEVDFAYINKTLSPFYSYVGINDNQVGEVAGEFFSRVSDTNIIPESNDKSVVARIAIVADIHSEVENLKKALSAISSQEVDYLLCMGDLTDFGEIKALEQVKEILDASAIEYDCIPGDRDLYDSVGPQNYESVFGVASGSRFFTKEISGIKLIFFDNSANYTPISADWLNWFSTEVTDATFIVMPQPLYQSLVSVLNPVMGIVNGEDVPEVKSQASILLQKIRSSDVKAIISADHHHSSQTIDEVDKSLLHAVVGALATSEKRNLQTPRYTIFTIYDDSSYTFEDIVL